MERVDQGIVLMGSKVCGNWNLRRGEKEKIGDGDWNENA